MEGPCQTEKHEKPRFYRTFLLSDGVRRQGDMSVEPDGFSMAKDIKT
jgi:hypothetical protein